MQVVRVQKLPAALLSFEHFPEHDQPDDGQEEVYTALAGSATLTAGGEEYRLEPGGSLLRELPRG